MPWGHKFDTQFVVQVTSASFAVLIPAGSLSRTGSAPERLLPLLPPSCRGVTMPPQAARGTPFDARSSRRGTAANSARC